MTEQVNETKAMRVQKRAQTLAVKKQQEQVNEKYSAIAAMIPDEWAQGEDAKMSLVKSIHSDVLGKDKEGKSRTLNDLRYFMFQAGQRKLNPFKKQIHAVYIWDSSKRAEQLTVITGIDGFRAIAQRSKNPLYAGVSAPTWEYDEQTQLPTKATVSVYAYNPVNGNREAITTGVAWYDEYVKLVDEKVDETDKDGKPVVRNGQNGEYVKKVPSGKKVPNSTWATRPRGQLAKCAEALALRAAFPEDLSGLYVYEEVQHLERETGDDTGSDDPLAPTELDRKKQAVKDALADRRKKRSEAKEGEIV
jgi:phage recombination protein Bet